MVDMNNMVGESNSGSAATKRYGTFILSTG